MRFLLKLIICLSLEIGAGFVLLAFRSGDVIYTAYEGISPARFHQFDSLIRTVAAAHELDPMLMKAVIWQESRFDPRKIGTAGERGLMQVSERAAREWAREMQLPDFHSVDLLDPKTNLEAGAWYLHRAFQHWQHQKNPAIFALAEYNAGASRAQRWANNQPDTPMSGQAFRKNHGFRRTR